jgi:hypothetical protein
MQTELFTLWVIGTVLWAVIAFIVVAQPIVPGGGEKMGLTTFLLFIFGPPLAVLVAALLAEWRARRRWRRGEADG